MTDTFEQELNIQSKICIENINNGNVDNLAFNQLINRLVNLYLYDYDEDSEMLLTKKLFSCQATGNYGLCLFASLQTNIINDEDIIPLTAYIVHWAITNHMKFYGKTHELLLYRGIIVKEYKKYFINEYKKVCAKKYDTHSIMYVTEINSTESTIDALFMNDLYSVKQHYSYYDDNKEKYLLKSSMIQNQSYFEEIHNSLVNSLLEEILSQQFE